MIIRTFLKWLRAAIEALRDRRRFCAVTVTDAVPATDPTFALTAPRPVLIARKVTGFPGSGEKRPSAGDTDQLGIRRTGLR